MRYKVHLDFGHGGNDPGAVGNTLAEKDITLSIGLQLAEILKQNGIDVNYSRSNDKFVGLVDRAMKANNAKADVFVSLHVNSAGNPKATGFEAWTSKGHTKADLLATKIGEQLQKDFPEVPFRKDMSDGDLDKEDNFTVLTKTSMPAVLIEYLFIVNPSDANILRTKQKELALSTANGIMAYLGIEPEVEDVLNLTINDKRRRVKGYIKDGKSYITVSGKDIPARAIGEGLGFTVGWNDREKAVIFSD